MTTFNMPHTPIIHLPETDSTSNYLAQASSERDVKEFTVVLTDFQTQGKGQRGNSWESERSKNLLFSTLIYPHFLEIRQQFLLSQVIALGIKEELDTFSEDFSIKWPNDIYWQERKISGTLIENDLLGNKIDKSIAGIGININQKEFYSSAPNPASLLQITGEEHDIYRILNGVMQRIIFYYEGLKQGHTQEIEERYHQALFRREGLHLYEDNAGRFLARIVKVKPVGTLVLKDEEGKQREYAFKEVRYIIS